MPLNFSRRVFIRSVAALAAGFASTVVPRGADAQPPASPRRIGVLLVTFPADSKEVQAFREGLRDAGYVEGRDVVIEWRSANGDFDQISQLVRDLIQRQVDVIVVDSTIAAQAVKRSTSTIPIVAHVGDPVGSGLVASLAHPGGNVTGISNMMVELRAKRLQLLKEVIPRLTRVGVLWNPDTPFHAKVVEDLKAVAPSLSIELSFMGARTSEQFGPAFSAASRAHAQALYVIGDPFFLVHRTALFELTSKARLPGIYGGRQFVVAGGLMSYGTDSVDSFRRQAAYVDTHWPAVVKRQLLILPQHRVVSHML